MGFLTVEDAEQMGELGKRKSLFKKLNKAFHPGLKLFAKKKGRSRASAAAAPAGSTIIPIAPAGSLVVIPAGTLFPMGTIVPPGFAMPVGVSIAYADEIPILFPGTVLPAGMSFPADFAVPAGVTIQQPMAAGGAPPYPGAPGYPMPGSVPFDQNQVAFPGSTIPAGTVLPMGTVLPSSYILPSTVSIGAYGQSPVWIPGTVLPQGTFLPPGYVLPLGVSIAMTSPSGYPPGYPQAIPMTSMEQSSAPPGTWAPPQSGTPGGSAYSPYAYGGGAYPDTPETSPDELSPEAPAPDYGGGARRQDNGGQDFEDQFVADQTKNELNGMGEGFDTERLVNGGLAQVYDHKTGFNERSIMPRQSMANAFDRATNPRRRVVSRRIRAGRASEAGVHGWGRKQFPLTSGSVDGLLPTDAASGGKFAIGGAVLWAVSGMLPGSISKVARFAGLGAAIYGAVQALTGAKKKPPGVTA